MKFIKHIQRCTCLLILMLSIAGCSQNKNTETPKVEVEQQDITSLEQRPSPKRKSGPKQLPVQYQTPTYKVDQQPFTEAFSDEKTAIKVGATIRSNNGPLPLKEILKNLASLKGMSISWASDVNRDVLVDVDIKASDDFYDAINSMLRQVDYFHEVQKGTIVVRYKETRQFHIAMPFIKSSYTTSTGGNMMGNNEGTENIDGTMALKSTDNPFDIWANVQANMDAILSTWDTNLETKAVTKQLAEEEVDSLDTEESAIDTPTATRRVSKGGTMYIIDKPIGLITVSAPRPLLDRLENYFDSLKTELYKQVAIDAKIIEVTMTDGSSVGIDWSGALSGLEISGNATLGNNGTVYDNSIPDSSNFNVTSLDLSVADFSVLISALNEQGDAKVLSNPKLSVMNGQPALITVGRNITYISSIEADRDTSTTGTSITYTAEVDSLLSGLGLGITATIMDDSEIIMNLVPVTSELSTDAVPYEQISVDGAESGGKVGVPIVNVREMSTTVKVKDGDTLIIGGLISEDTRNDNNSVPVLSEIPFLGALFKSETKAVVKKELVILIQPRII